VVAVNEYLPRELIEAPDSLVSGGKWNFGTFNTQFRLVNPLDAERPLGPWVPQPMLPFRLKEWQAFQLGNERWFMLAVLYNAKFSALAQFIAYDKHSKKKFVFDRMLPPGSVKVPPSIWDSRQSYSHAGASIEIISKLESGRFYINVRLDEMKGQPAVEAHFEAIHDNGMVEPIVVSIPFGSNRGMYSHKCLMPMQGNMSIGGEKAEFKRGESFAIIDDHKGFYPYIMHYDWVTAAGFNNNKQIVGFNLTDNQSIDPDRFNENCLWVDGRLHLLPPVKFNRPDGAGGRWLIKDSYGMVDLSFQPESMQEINMNALVIKVRYRGPFGYLSGFIKDRYGARTGFDNFFGMGEEKYIRG
jgi:hypothetical protein